LFGTADNEKLRIELDQTRNYKPRDLHRSDTTLSLKDRVVELVSLLDLDLKLEDMTTSLYK